MIKKTVFAVLILGFCQAGITKEYPLMQFDFEQLEILRQYQAELPRFGPGNNLPQEAVLPKSIDLRPYLEIVPEQRDQGICGNCWVWADTAILETALAVQKQKQRLSVQFFNSCLSKIATDDACCGGFLKEFVSFYDQEKIVISWSNFNAGFSDADVSIYSCPQAPSNICCECVSKIPAIKIKSIRELFIDAAVQNIKEALCQNMAIEFVVFMLADDWSNFFGYFGNGDDQPFSFDYSCGKPFSPQYDTLYGHAMTIVGYDETGPVPYWIVLNSWGIADGFRPDAVFKLAMDMDYSCFLANVDSGYDYYTITFQTIDVEYGETTYCPIAFVLGQDQLKLDLFRDFRDSKLKTADNGLSLTSLYYQHSAEITQILSRDMALTFQAAEILSEMAEALYLQKDLLKIDKNLLEKALNLADSISDRAGSDLKEDIKKIKNQIK